nr:hypothetical protein [Mycobacterium leprae]
MQKTQHAKFLTTRELVAARDAAARALDGTRRSGSADPLAAFAHLAKVDMNLNRLLGTLAEKQIAAR